MPTSLSWYSHRLRETLGLYRYTHAQTYTVEYRLLFSNTTNDSVTVAIPLPTNTDSQDVHDFSVLLPNTSKTRDEEYGNHVLVVTTRVYKASCLPVWRCRLAVRPMRGVRGVIKASPPLSGSEKMDPRIANLARQLSPGSCRRETAQYINNYIVTHLTYGDPIDGLYSDVDALTRSRVDCGGFVSLFVSLCRAHDIPARLVSGFWLDGKKNDMHAWAEFQDEAGAWIPVDPSVEQLARLGRTQKSGRFGFMGSDRLTLSHGNRLPIPWNNKIFYAPILQHPFILRGQLSCRADIHVARHVVRERPDTSSI